MDTTANAAGGGVGFRGHGREMLDVLAYIVLMFFTALGVAIALACVVLLLATPARAAGADDAALQPAGGETGRGTLLFKARDGGRLRVPLQETRVHIQISGPLAHVRVEQRFRNPADQWFEGIYVFPLPEDAAVSHMRMKIGERVVESEVQEKSRARETYRQARAAGQRSALLEQERPNMFTTSVANIGPHEDVVVELEYRQQIAYRIEHGVGRFGLRFPLVVGPRYLPGGPAGVEDAGRITPPVAGPGEAALNPVDILVDLDAGLPIGEVSSPHHSVQILRVDDRRRRIMLADGSTPADRDFELEWTIDGGEEPAVSLFFEPGPGGRNYALLSLMPPAAASEAPRQPREVVYVVDTSGSMEGDSIRQARAALALALKRLTPQDSFNVIAFASEAAPLFPAAQPASARNVAFAAAWVDRLRAEGGTEMEAALRLALADDGDESRIRQVVFLTDGAVGNEAGLFELIQRRLGRSRLFTVGIGSAPNGYFMRKAAEFGRGSFTYVGRIDQVGSRIGALFERLESPLVRDIEVRWSGTPGVEMWPATVPDLYLGEPVVVAAALESLQGAIVVEGRIGERRWRQRIELAGAGLGSGVGQLWARRKIDALMDRLSSGADEAQIRAEVLPLALGHELVSRYTSFVAVDRTPARPAGDDLHSARLPTNLPQGWDHAAVFGQLPHGATDSRWYLASGMAAVALAFVLLLLARRRDPSET